MALTPKQEKVLKFISDYKDDKWLSPTIVELQMGLWFKSIHSVTQFLNSLEKKWYVHRWWWFRSLTLTNSVWFQLTFDIPVIWLANASNPTVYAEENRIWNIAVSQSIIKWDKDKYFFLKIEWTSMNQFKVNWKIIFDWSMVLVNGQDRTVNEQDAFLCILNGFATIKKIKKEVNSIYLLPCSSDSVHKPIILDKDDNIFVNGKVIDVFNI